ncbi:unnamed protein product [Schistosoma curassoni]|uniref:DUF223 domain-containing protein n=1 Tax=Schistosoma curassoni TaxID=6186 RepID=A0A183L4G2_9TREM|nr:unnamed protein product [Schistosoma curassoni]
MAEKPDKISRNLAKDILLYEITNIHHNVLPDLKYAILRIPSSYNNSNTTEYHIGFVMESVIVQLDIRSNSEAFEDYMERFEIWSRTRKDVKDDKVVAHCLTLVVIYFYEENTIAVM